MPAASKVDLPEPGTPVTRVRPRRRSQASTISFSIPEFLEARRRAGQNPERDVDRKTARGLHRGEVATEAPEDAARLGDGMGTIDGPAAAQDAFAGGIEDARAQAAERDAVERRAGRPRQPAVDLEEGGRAGLEGDVGGAELRGP